MNDLKAQVFPKYYGQKVFSYPDKEGSPDLMLGSWIDLVSSDLWENAFLQLRSISSLTDEECINIAAMVDVEYSQYRVEAHFDRDGFVEFVEALFNEEPGCYIDCYKGNTILIVIDYLRSISIALPVTVLENGKPVTYSVDELVGKGIVKIG